MSIEPSDTEPISCSRRGFLARVGAAAVGTAAIDVAAAPAAAGAQPVLPKQSGSEYQRRQAAYDFRVTAARLAKDRPMPSHPTNGDEGRYANKIGSYSKGLPHDALGEVDPIAYAALRHAIGTNAAADFNQIPLGDSRRLTNPQAGLAFDLEGSDSHHLTVKAAPALASREAAGELVELYWMALARDVSFIDYPGDATIAAAAAELSTLTSLPAPRQGGLVTPGTLFRGLTTGDLVGPYLSQFLWLDIQMGAVPVPQRIHTSVPGQDYLTTYAEWLAVQNGYAPAPNVLDPTLRYIRNLRDLARWVQVDALYQAYHQAALILLAMGAPFDAGNPYNNSPCQDGFGTFGGPHILSLVTEVATRALKAVWYQKWFVHRRLRPEAMAGLVHHTRAGTRQYPLHPDVLNSDAAAHVHSVNGSWLLPMAFSDGCPTHPSYGAGHATVAGACVTVLKAWFDESFVLQDPVVAAADGLSLLPYTGPTLTVGNELDKLAANVGIGRNAGGVHFRSDYSESLLLGEQVALTILEEQKASYNEPFSFHLTTFDGTEVVV